MQNRGWGRALAALGFAILYAGGVSAAGSTAPRGSYWGGSFCTQSNFLCTDSEFPIDNGKYIGHDEPSVLFYSSTPGSGNSAMFTLVLPKDPPVMPKQNGSGGTFNFQLHPAFWFGMAMCDTQSAPEATGVCPPDSDANIFDNSDPNASDYVGNHPGTAFMEMQFYPPGWATWPAGNSCDGTHWCAALNIDSLSVDMNSGTLNNNACNTSVGEEPVNFAFITKSGVADSAGDPLNFNHFIPNLKKDLLMKGGDTLVVDMHDTSAGFTVIIYDLTSHTTGSMTASVANKFAQVVFDPSASTCTSTLYAFHPMYATSGPHTRVPWSAHSYNVSFADEIGHFEYCDQVDPSTLQCVSPGVNDPQLDDDDFRCFDKSQSSRVKITGCTATDGDFDGVPYQLVWPGTIKTKDRSLHPQPIVFRSPLFRGSGGVLTNYSQAAFEADLPRIELTPPNNCDRSTGSGCVNPPLGANFYPFFSNRSDKNLGCAWQLGGDLIPNTTNDFGGNSAAEYGSLLALTYPSSGGPFTVFNDFRNILSDNPCAAPMPALSLPGPSSKPIPFGTKKVGTTSKKPLKISNAGAYPIDIVSLSPSVHYGIFAGTDKCSGATLLPKGSCGFTATFTPDAPGTEDGTITVSSDAANNNGQISFTGAGK